MLPGPRLIDVARRLLEQQPDPPRRVTLGDVVEIHKPTLFYAFVALPLVAVIGTVVRASQPVQLDVLAKLVALVVVGAALIMGWTLFRLRESLRNGIAATAEIVDASPWAGRIRVNLDGRPLVTAYRSNSLERLAAGDRITVLLDPRKEAVLLTLGRARV